MTTFGFGGFIAEVDVAVAQFLVVQTGFLGALTCQLGHAGNGFTLLFALLDFLLNDFGNIQIFVQKVVDLLFDEVAYKLIDAHAAQFKGIAFGILVGRHGERTEFDFGLRLKGRFDDTNGNGGDKAVAHILHIVVFAEILLDGARDVLLKCTLVRTALSGVLAVDKGIVFLTILAGVGKSDVQIFVAQVHDGVQPLGGHVVGEQIFQTVTRDGAAAVDEDGKTGVEVGVVAQHRFDKFGVETIAGKEGGIGLKEDVSTVFFLGGTAIILNQPTGFKDGFTILPLAVAARHKTGGEGVDGFQTHAVQSDGGRVLVAVVLSTGVQLRNGFNQAARRNASTIVANGGGEVVGDVYFYFFAKPGVELVDAVVDALFEQDVNAVLGMRSVSQAPDVHARTHTDVGHIVEVADGIVAIIGGVTSGLRREVFCHVENREGRLGGSVQY